MCVTLQLTLQSKPNQIVAGLEADVTNRFLQQLGVLASGGGEPIDEDKDEDKGQSIVDEAPEVTTKRDRKPNAAPE